MDRRIHGDWSGIALFVAQLFFRTLGAVPA